MLKKWKQDHIQQLLFFFMRQHWPDPNQFDEEEKIMIVE
jgi:hypothetical protein